jgi:hypothetical protein
MPNSANLNKFQTHYDVTFQGKNFQCARVSDVIESTSPTPLQIKKWIVNCAVKALAKNGVRKIDINDPANESFLKVLKLVGWSAHEFEQQQALDVGTRSHGNINRDAFDAANSCEESKACWKAFEAFRKDFVLVPIAKELCLYDVKNRIAGTTDWIGLIANHKACKGRKKAIFMLDWKTSKAISETYKIQIVIYKHMLTGLIKAFQRNPSHFDEANTRILNDIILAAGKNPKILCGVVRLNKNPNARKFYEFVELTAKEEKQYLKEFKLMIQLFNHRKEYRNGSVRF